MATYQQTIRQGLPRIAGGPGWPAAGVLAAAVPATATVATQVPPVAVAPAAAPSAPEPVIEAAAPEPVRAEAPAVPPVAVVGTAAPAARVALRRGLPRVSGGEPWPPAGETIAAAAAVPATGAVPAPVAAASAEAASASVVSAAAPVGAVSAAVVAAAVVSASASAVAGETVVEEVVLRRGLPRVVGGEAWPAVGTAVVRRVVAAVVEPVAGPAVVEPVAGPAHAAAGDAAGSVVPDLVAPVSVPVREPAAPAPEAGPAAAAPAVASNPAQAQVQAPVPTRVPARVGSKREPRVIGSRTLGAWVRLGVFGAVGAVVAAAVVVLAARGVTTLPGVPGFLERYPGEYHLPEWADPGFPAWARWTHFLNVFLMVLIIRTGLQVRHQQKPPAFWTPKKGGKKISINLWLHTSLDLLWLVNGVVFVVLLFASGHWVRIVPTSWEVFPNAASALLQYLTLEWPVENGWVNYNSLQQLMYFLVVFVAAPLAAVTGVRMSEWWPEKAERLNRWYPAPVARAVHFPTMLFFVLFIVVHVFLVLSTGALRNLNHMFAGSDVVNWVGFWWFAAGLFVTVGAVWGARPLVVAPIASLFGRVSNR